MDGLSGLFLSKQRVRPGEKVLSDASLSSVERDIQQAIQALGEGGGKVVLVVDQLDFLLAAGGEQVGAVSLGEMVLGLREVCFCFCFMLNITG